MRLKKIRLAGFKSFVDPTNILFPSDMTAIVGPNGCGKSNVIDAVRWVLGESSAKNLRGDAMTDVIFNGSTSRKPVSQCSVELVFDNSLGRLQGEYAAYAEVAVKRLVTREGQSHYLLNSNKCRKRDITDLFLGTGLGPRSYAIIEQGMISRLIESKPQELRTFIEEAAGISRYKERRRETEGRIRHCRENLERLNDVRSELERQLDKLEEQARDAKAYKALKATERQLKAELAAIRWQQHEQAVQSLEHKISQKQRDIEAITAKQRQEEVSLTALIEKQQDGKQRAVDLQQRYFQLANQITRLEQHQLHAQNRQQQIGHERIDLQRQERQLTSALEEGNNKQQALHQEQDQLQQSNAIAQEQLHQCQATLEGQEQQVEAIQQQRRQQEQQLNELKQRAGSHHSKMQAALQMQMRTEERIGQLQEELQQLQGGHLSANLQEVETALTLAQQQQIALEQQQAAQQQIADELADALTQAIPELEEGQQQALEWRTEYLSLQTLEQEQNQANEALEQWQSQLQDSQWQALWQWLEVEPKWQQAAETVLATWPNAMVLLQENEPAQGKSSTQSPVLETVLETLPKISLFDLRRMTPSKPAGTLASVCHNPEVPWCFTQITLAEKKTAAMALRDKLKPEQSLITESGFWLGADWCIGADGPEQRESNPLLGVLRRQQKMQDLQQQLDQLEPQLAQMKQQVQSLQERSEAGQIEGQRLQEAMQSVALELQQRQTQQRFIQQQIQDAQTQLSKNHEVLQQQQTLLLQEQQEQEQAAQSIALLEAQIDEAEHLLKTTQEREEQELQRVNDLRHRLKTLTAEQHQLALSTQDKQSQTRQITSDINNQQEQLQQVQLRLQMLQQEEAQLNLPVDSQQDELQVLLQQKAAMESEQSQHAEALQVLEQELETARSGQQGVQHKVQKLQQSLANLEVECEGYRVRRNGVVEQLQDMQQDIQPLLARLPNGASEKVWQNQLERNHQQLSELGAVNLAAVEEFEVQQQRKHHLDTQNNDLVAALETLESAIRKIDRETRTRFKETFEQVNRDLGSLFPKVFGGGSAYLALTDDDLLETGVTIMARPPGKKNSTIHLLSGGEKALTALSLVFAIFRLNPAPFCLLDEVDAPLDDANVVRFCKLVTEMSKSVQFIYISHNKIAMEMASHLTGVTMAEPGVSRIVAVDVEEAVAISNA